MYFWGTYTSGLNIAADVGPVLALFNQMALSYFQESLRHAVIDLQTQTDEKALIGKLHRQIVSMQSKENENAQKMATLETKMAR